MEASGKIGLAIKGWSKEARPVIVKDPKAVEEIKGRFASKYGLGSVERYYPTSEVALVVPV